MDILQTSTEFDPRRSAKFDLQLQLDEEEMLNRTSNRG
jgi:hypothetical protein